MVVLHGDNLKVRLELKSRCLLHGCTFILMSDIRTEGIDVKADKKLAEYNRHSVAILLTASVNSTSLL